MGVGELTGKRWGVMVKKCSRSRKGAVYAVYGWYVTDLVTTPQRFNKVIDIMAKVNIALSGPANILALVNAANPTLNATAAQVTIGNPSVVAGTGGRNTAITLTAVDNQGFSGTQTFAYTRQALASGGAIAAAKDVPVVVAPADDAEAAFTKVVAALGLVATEVTAGAFTAPVNEDTPGSIVVNPIANSLLYTGSYTAVLDVPDADVPLSEAASTTDLSGFDAE